VTRAIELEPNLVFAYQARGTAYAHKREYERAIQDYDQALRLNPYADGVLVGRGLTRFYLGQFGAAQADFTRALTLKPTDPFRALYY
jgi:lipoprotein NlpI